jgi:hypothetical protein
MRGLRNRRSRRHALVWTLLPLVGASPASAAVIVPVSLSRTVSASSSVQDDASGTEDVDPGQSSSSTDPSFTLSIGASSSSSLLGWSAQSSAGSGTVSTVDLGPGLFGLNLTLSAQASVGTSAACPACSASASSIATLALTFDLTAPIHVSAFAALGGFAHPSAIGMALVSGGQVIAYGGTQGSLPFDLSPGRYTLQGSAGAAVRVAPFQLVPTSYASLLGVLQYTVIPEPSTGLLLFAGLLGLARGRRRLTPP